MSQQYLQLLIDSLKKQEIAYQLSEKLMSHTSFQIGGDCCAMVVPKNIDEIVITLKLCRLHQIPLLLLGNGSNLLVSDDGFHGVVMKFGHNFSNVIQVDGHTIFAQSGARLAKVCHFAMQRGLGGLSFAYGIPATVGGSIYMNAGAYGGEMKDVVRQVCYLDDAGEQQQVSDNQLAFSYRHSFFTDTSHCITGAYFSLQPQPKEQIKQEMDIFYAKRKKSQPLEYPSAGSTFKRPEGAYAAQLIEQCGLKGYYIGGAQVSSKHSGFVINQNNASFEDVSALIAHIQKTVLEQTGFSLTCEVKMITPDLS